MRVLQVMRALTVGLRSRSRDHQPPSQDESPPPEAAAPGKTASRSRHGGKRQPDETVRNAVAFLAQEDAESALVFALVHDPEFRLASALATVGTAPRRVRSVLRPFSLFLCRSFLALVFFVSLSLSLSLSIVVVCVFAAGPFWSRCECDSSAVVCV